MKTYHAAEAVKHRSAESCWVVLYGDVYDVTEFLPSHPGSSKIILELAGQDATEEYDPVHPPGTLEENLKASAKLGKIDPASLPKPKTDSEEQKQQADDGPVDLENLLNLDEIEEVATKEISKKAWAYYFSAADDLISKSLNNTVYWQILLRPRVFVDCTGCDLSITLLGHPVGIPLYVAPAAMARLAHPAGKQGIARGIGKFGAVQIVSNNASMTLEQIVEGALPGKREHDEKTQNVASSLPAVSGVRARRKEAKKKEGPGPGPGGGLEKALFLGTAADLTWERTLPWLARHTTLPIVLKGLQTHEDAYLEMQHAPQVQAIILSNHGGRALDTAPPAVHTLLEIWKYCPEVFGKIEVWIDWGIKRGTDVVKALCLGAKVVGVGRAALFGLGAGGAEGVGRTFEIVKGEIDTSMRLLGVEKVSELGLRHTNTRAVERDIYDGHAGLDKSGLWVKANL